MKVRCGAGSERRSRAQLIKKAVCWRVGAVGAGVAALPELEKLSLGTWSG